MISNKYIVDAANTKIAAGNLTELEVTQLSSIQQSLNNSAYSVNALIDLPTAADNTGRMIYVTSLGKYYFSDGSEWLIDYSSTYEARSILYATGQNNSGMLGVGKFSNQALNSAISPMSVIGNIGNWKQVSSGSTHVLAISGSGTLYAWGSNSNGMLGDGNAATTSYASPTSFASIVFTNWSQVSAGNAHSLGLLKSLTNENILYAWGSNSDGRLGDTTTTNKSSPVSVAGGITNWSKISAGQYHSLGVTSSGIAYAWGRNATGQLGDTTVTSRVSPIVVAGSITTWSSISAGYHSLGVTSSGIAYAWGRNNYGQLGDGTNVNKSSPVSVVGGITNWSQVSAGLYHSLGITSSGTAYAWGRNNAGQLGDNTTVSKSSPVSVVGGITNWSQISSGKYHSAAITSSGLAYAWGQAFTGALGTGSTVGQSSPAPVAAGAISSWSIVNAGQNTTFFGASNTRGFNT